MREAQASGGRGGAFLVPALSVTLVVLLAASWLLAGHLVARMPALVVAAGRTGAAFVALCLIAMPHRARRAEMRAAAGRWRSIALLGFLGFFSYYAGTMIGTGMIGASRAGLISSLLPCITFVIGAFAFGEPVTRRRVAGTLLAGLGAFGYALADSPGGAQGGTSTLAGGAFLAFAGTASYAVYGYLFRNRMADLPALSALPAITGAGTAMLGLAVLLFVPANGIAWADWAGLAALGAFLTAPVFVLLHELILRKGPLFTAGLTLMVPILLRLGEWGLGREGPPGLFVLALLLACAAGVWLTISGPGETGRR